MVTQCTVNGLLLKQKSGEFVNDAGRCGDLSEVQVLSSRHAMAHHDVLLCSLLSRFSSFVLVAAGKLIGDT